MPGNFMIFPPIPFSPYEIDGSRENLRKEVRITLRRMNPRSEEFRLRENMTIDRIPDGLADLLGAPQLAGRSGVPFGEVFASGREDAQRLVAERSRSAKVEPAEAIATTARGQRYVLGFSSYTGPIVRKSGVKVRVHADDEGIFSVGEAYVSHDLVVRDADAEFFQLLGIAGPGPAGKVGLDALLIARLADASDALAALRRRLHLDAEPEFERELETIQLNARLALPEGTELRIEMSREILKYPFRPNRRHRWGLDESGRDVLARCIHAFRVAMSFGVLLVTLAMVMGFAIGSLQGYFGGITDLSGQRLIEIWSAIPFLYVIILMGDIFGKGFMVLLVCYGIFNWIGISYYVRAEFLKLRGAQFVEAARALGLPWYRIIIRHILPNSLTPMITFFPFNLMGAVAVLSALDYLGYGLPPPTPSWGEMLGQAMAHRNAWWLVVCPGLCLFTTMLLTVFIGEGIRDAFDPKEIGKWRG